MFKFDRDAVELAFGLTPNQRDGTDGDRCNQGQEECVLNEAGADLVLERDDAE